MSVEPGRPDLGALHKSVTVRQPVNEAFAVFTERIGRWWPLGRYSISQERAVDCVIEGHAGGAVYELRDDGERFSWGRVLAWEPPHRLLLSWHPGRETDAAQEVEVRFTPTETGTRVELEHRGWDRLGEQAREARDSYAGGWDTVLGRHFVEACNPIAKP